MKKSVKSIIIAAIVVLVLLLVLIGIIFVYLNKPKKSITADEFKSYMSEKGYNITDLNSQITRDDNIKQAYSASNNDDSIYVKIYEFNENNDAIVFYSNSISIYETPSTSTEIKGKNYSKYALSYNGRYIKISRINNTVISSYVDDTYENEVKTIFNELGY